MRAGRELSRSRGNVTSWRVAAVLSVAGLLGCTDAGVEELVPAPAPTPAEEPASAPAGRDIEVVLPPADSIDGPTYEALHRRVSHLSASLPDDVGELTVRRPDTAPFVVDLAELAASRGSGLVCLLGADTAATTDTLAERYGGVTFCGLPTELPDVDEDGQLPTTPAARVDLPVADLGQLVGVAAASVASEGDDDPVVGLLLGGDELPPTVFRDGLLRGLVDVEVVEVEGADATPEEAVESLLAADARVIVFDGHAATRDAIAALDGRAAVVAPVAVVDAVAETDAALGYRLRHEVALAAVFASFSSGTLPEVPLLFGSDDEVLELRVGPDRPGLEALLERERAALAQRDDPRAPVPDGPGAGAEGGL